MRRVDRVRFEKRRRVAGVAGLFFAVGALTAGILDWRAELRLLNPTAGAEAPLAGAAGAAAAERTEPDRQVATTGASEPADVVARLRARGLAMPLDDVPRSALRDSFEERRGGVRKHEAIDIMAPRGTPVRAVEDGHVAKLFTSIAGGLTVYLFDAREQFAYYYAHLDRYAPGLQEKQAVRRGDLIGYVGSTGNAAEDAPHLHFAIFQLTPERRWWQGDPINPFAVLSQSAN